uniref:RING-type domain-containing protein n=1 Tax=Spongospora subterranea TaxID=70186 RepID=A0A0H5RAL5_9EUKA|eukprot:CRZ11205.1 hypothetical protein [Spongospora subterranea]
MDLAIYDRRKSSPSLHRSGSRPRRSGLNGATRQSPNLHTVNYRRSSKFKPRITAADASFDGPWTREKETYCGSSRSNIADYINARFRFALQKGTNVDGADVPWAKVEYVTCWIYDDNFFCPICLDPPSAAQVTKCGHIFCLPCILRHLRQRSKSKCPLCFAIAVPEELRSLELIKRETAAIGDTIQMSLLTRLKDQLGPNPVDASLSNKFSRFLETGAVHNLIDRELNELNEMASSCEGCAETAVSIQNAIKIVLARKERSSAPGRPEAETSASVINAASDDRIYYFYQCSNGTPVFLHSLNYRCLVEEYGLDFPLTVHGRILDLFRYQQTTETQNRFRFLRHLPLSTNFYIAELDIDHYLSKDTIELFSEESDSRDAARKDQLEQKILCQESHDKRTSTPITINKKYLEDPYPVPQVTSTDCFPSLPSSPPLNSPTVKGVIAPIWRLLAAKFDDDICVEQQRSAFTAAQSPKIKAKFTKVFSNSSSRSYNT